MTTQTRETSGTSDFDWFSDNGIFMPMINDTNRNVYYKAAIERAAPGKVVCDIGCGTGMLSVMAAKAGAKKVYAIEMDPGRADFARNIIKKIGYSDVIEVIHADFLDLDIPADIYVSETIGAQIFNENIINLAEHARKYGGTFIPGQFDIWAVMYENHPIFSITAEKSEAFEFQPDVNIHQEYEDIINTEFQNKHPLADTLYQANSTRDLFQMLYRFNDLKLNKLYTTPEITVDLNQQVNVDNLRIVIPYSAIPTIQSGIDTDVAVVMFWRAKHQDIIMESTECWWSHVSKVILTRTRQPDTDIELYYDPAIDNWRLKF